MKVITAASVHDALASLVPQLASVLPDDILAGLIAAREVETGDRARIVLDQLVENARIAKQDKCLFVRIRVPFGFAWRWDPTFWFLEMFFLE